MRRFILFSTHQYYLGDKIEEEERGGAWEMKRAHRILVEKR
jgi:hypothetical protein